MNPICEYSLPTAWLNRFNSSSERLNCFAMTAIASLMFFSEPSLPNARRGRKSGYGDEHQEDPMSNLTLFDFAAP